MRELRRPAGWRRAKADKVAPGPTSISAGPPADRSPPAPASPPHNVATPSAKRTVRRRCWTQ